jgi:hypothetical protein
MIRLFHFVVDWVLRLLHIVRINNKQTERFYEDNTKEGLVGSS